MVLQVMSAWCEGRREDWFCTHIGWRPLRAASAFASFFNCLLQPVYPPPPTHTTPASPPGTAHTRTLHGTAVSQQVSDVLGQVLVCPQQAQPLACIQGSWVVPSHPPPTHPPTHPLSPDPFGTVTHVHTPYTGKEGCNAASTTAGSEFNLNSSSCCCCVMFGWLHA